MSDPSNSAVGSDPTKTGTSPSSHSNLSEAEYLRRQATEAKAAVTLMLGQAKSALTGAADPRDLTRTHPFVAIGSAAVAGFVTALLTIPSKEQQELRRIEKVQRALHPEPPTPQKESDNATKPAQSMWSTIIKEGIAAIRPLLVTAITAGLNAQANAAKGPANSTEPGVHPVGQAPNNGR